MARLVDIKLLRSEHLAFGFTSILMLIFLIMVINNNINNGRLDDAFGLMMFSILFILHGFVSIYGVYEWGDDRQRAFSQLPYGRYMTNIPQLLKRGILFQIASWFVSYLSKSEEDVPQSEKILAEEISRWFKYVFSIPFAAYFGPIILRELGTSIESGELILELLNILTVISNFVGIGYPVYFQAAGSFVLFLASAESAREQFRAQTGQADREPQDIAKTFARQAIGAFVLLLGYLSQVFIRTISLSINASGLDASIFNIMALFVSVILIFGWVIVILFVMLWNILVWLFIFIIIMGKLQTKMAEVFVTNFELNPVEIYFIMPDKYYVYVFIIVFITYMVWRGRLVDYESTN